MARKKRPVTPEDIHRLHFVGAPRVSPDGSRIVFTHKKVGAMNEYITDLWTVPTDGSAPAAPFTSGERDGSPQWSPDGSWVAFVSGREDKRRPQIYRIGADGGEARAVTRFTDGSVGPYRISPDGTQVAVAWRETHHERTRAAEADRKAHGLSDPPWVIDDWWYRLDGDGYFGEQRYKLYIVDVATGEHRAVYTKDTLGFFTFDWSPDGRHIAITTNRHKKALIKAATTEILILDVKRGKTRSLPLPDGPKTQVRWSPDGRKLAYAGRTGEDDVYSTHNLELWVADAQTGRSKSLTGKTDECLMSVTITDTSAATFDAWIAWSPDSRTIHTKIGRHGSSRLASIPARGGELTFVSDGRADWDVGNIAGDGTTVALVRSTMTRPPEIAVGRMGKDGIDVDVVTDFHGDYCREVALVPCSSSWVKSTDGARVQCWTMMPPGHKRGARKKYPAVLEVHGGPHGQYGIGYFHEFQVLASNGYAVFFSNPRGSKGYGQAHCEAIRGAWGTKDWDDIQAVTESIKAHPNTDTERIGIMGGSYGGYMTNWAIGHSRDYRAAITDRCVSNMVSMAGNSDFIWEPDGYFAGNAWDRSESRWEQSPMRWLGKCRTPTLVIHSEGDLRCNVEQAEQVFITLKLLNVPTRFVRYPSSTSHGMSRGGPPDLRIHRLHQILEWWQRYL